MSNKQKKSSHVPHLNVGILGRGALGHGVAWCLTTRDFTWVDLRHAVQIEVSALKICFVCVKAYDVASALAQLLPRLTKGCVVVVLANGYLGGVMQDVARRWPEIKLRRGMATIGVTERSDRSFIVASSSGGVFWGSESGDAPSAFECELWQTSTSMAWLADIALSLRRKWLFNAALNSLCGMHRLARNGLARQLWYEARLRQLFDESWQLGVELFGVWPAAKEQMWTELLQLVDATAQNENSMARDVRLRRRTEAQYFTGYAVGRNGYPQLKLAHAVLA